MSSVLKKADKLNLTHSLTVYIIKSAGLVHFHMYVAGLNSTWTLNKGTGIIERRNK